MKSKILCAVWALMYALCAGLGFLGEPAGAARWLLVVLAAIFFLPPLLLTWQWSLEKNANGLKLVTLLAAAWLVAAPLLLIANFLSIAASEAVGNFLYYVLILATSPMVCGQYWVMSFFGWACVLIYAGTEWKKQKKADG